MAISKKATEFAGLPVIEYQPAIGLVLPTMPPRVFRSKDSKTTWSISLEGERLLVDSKSKKHDTPELAQDRYRSLISEKIKQGFTEQKQADSTVREALLSALVNDPEDVASRNALADYLQEQGEKFPAVAYRVDESGYGEKGYGTLDNLQSFLAEPAVGLVDTLVIGSCWAMADSSRSSAELVKVLIAARNRLTSLRALFLGDITYQECEISWIVHSDLTDLLSAFPKLEHFRTRGGNELRLRPFEHSHLKSLIFEASNLPREVVVAVGESKLPALEHLEFWLGTDEYGADTTPADLEQILQGDNLPSLKYLGIRNSEIVDDIVPTLAGAPLLERLRVLDLSLGNLSDQGAQALLTIPGLANLEKLDIHHHYVSADLVEQLKALGIKVHAVNSLESEDPDDPDAYRFIAHTE